MRLISVIGLGFLFSASGVAAASFELVKGESFDTVYFVDNEDVRHPFPNRAVFQSWYGDDFSEVRTISTELLATYPLGENIFMRSGNLVKVPSANEVYVTEQGGVLRRIDHEDLAIHFFGNDWSTKVIDLPEVFFGAYSIGDPILSTSDVPDGVLYKLSSEDSYYWKNRDVLTRFKDFQTVVRNKFNTTTIIQDIRPYFTRNHIISEIEPGLFNPVVAANSSTADCAAEKLRAGIIYLHNGVVTDDVLENLARLKDEFPAYWHEQSRTFSTFSFPSPIQLVAATEGNRIPNKFGRYEVTHEIGFDYYNQLSDTVDFIIVFTDFPVGEKEEAYFSPITQSYEGIGKNRLDRSALFGSQGKLKGMVVMGDLDDFSFFEKRSVDSLYNIVSHELLHNWSGTLKNRRVNGVIQSDLLSQDGQHWSPYVSFSSPLGGRGWYTTEEGTLSIDTTLSDSLARPFSDLDLYTMGLIPPQLIDPIGFINDLAISTTEETIEGTLEEIAIEEIIDAHGRINCVLPS